MKRRKFLKTNLNAVAAVSVEALSSTSLKGNNQSNSKISVGFSSIDLSTAIYSYTKFRKPLIAVCTVFQAETITALITVDLIQFSSAENRDLQQKIARALNIFPDNVIIHTSHTHSSPWNAREAGQQIVDLHKLLIQVVSEAIKNSKPALMRVSKTNVGKSLSVYRRANTGDDLGIQTFWFGYTFDEGDDRPNASALVNEMKSRWLKKKPEYVSQDKPVWFDADVDPDIQSMCFEDENGNNLGCIIRFAAHPHLTCACKDWQYDPDYPGVVREVAGKELNCPVMFLTGACLDLVPKEKVIYKIDWDKVPPYPYMGPSSAFYPENEEKLLAENERIGRTIAEKALEGLKNTKTEKIDYYHSNSDNFSVPLDPALPKNKEEIDTIRKALVAEYDASLKQNNPLRELRGIANRLNWLEWSAVNGIQALSDKDRDAGEIKMPLSAIVFNSTALLFMHSEISVKTTVMLQKELKDLDVWSMGLTGGSLNYIPTATIYDEGGYEGRATISHRDAEAKVRKDLVSLLS